MLNHLQILIHPVIFWFGHLLLARYKANDGATASLNNLIDWQSYPDIKYGIKFGYKNIGWSGKFYTFPYFLAFLLKRFLKEKTAAA